MFYREAGQFKTSYAADQAIFPIRQDRLGMLAILVIAYLVVPFAANEYWLSTIFVPFFVFAVAALGLNILTGYAGQLSLGTGGFMAVGAFAAYKLATAFPGLNIVLVFIAAGLVTAGVGLLFGIPSLRIKGFYLAVATLAAKNMVRGRVGRAWMAIRDMDIAAEIIGIRPLRTKLLAFAVSSFYIGVAGALWAFIYTASVEALAFDVDRSFQILFMIIIGGLGSILGSFLGAAFIILLPILLNNLPGLLGINVGVTLVTNLQDIVYGLLIVFFLIVEPNGLARLWQIGKEKLRLWPFPH